MRFGHHSDCGTVRQSNEDCAWAGMNQFNNVAGIICDGLGGYKGGSAASEITVNVFRDKFENTDLNTFTTDQLNSWMKNIIEQARNKISEHIFQNPKLTNMATTLVCAIIISGKIHIFNVGDSRAYILSRDNESKQITIDQNLYNYLKEIRAPIELFRQHRDNLYAITQFIGCLSKKEVKMDSYSLDWNHGDFIVLTSDGCHNFVEIKDMVNVLKESEYNLSNFCLSIINKALSNNSNDNLSVVILGDK